MSTAQVRDARPGDQAAIRDVTLAAYQEYAAEMPAHWEGYRQHILDTLAAIGRGGPAAQIVAERDRVIAGTVVLYPAGATLFALDGVAVKLPWPEVRLLAVAPAARGQGVGLTLMEECVRRARQAGAPALALHTTDMMRAAVRLYVRMGFARTPELDFHPGPGLTVKGFRLDLPAEKGTACST
jgi:GNAT superfamily N-acetyltransferase